ncbi:hypothetical protein OAG71_02275 [bacterium]|nr:hypothetical protein [bacterium]
MRRFLISERSGVVKTFRCTPKEISPIVGPVQLTHPSGFDDAMFALFGAQCHLWTTSMLAFADGWTHLRPNDTEPPQWQFDVPSVSDDRTLVSLPVGDSLQYAHAKLFLDIFPRELYEHFPNEFRAQLECRVSPEANWRSVAELESNARAELLRLAGFAGDAPA